MIDLNKIKTLPNEVVKLDGKEAIIQVEALYLDIKYKSKTLLDPSKFVGEDGVLDEEKYSKEFLKKYESQITKKLKTIVKKHTTGDKKIIEQIPQTVLELTVDKIFKHFNEIEGFFQK